MQEKTVVFKRQRELGEIISDTFKFVRENFKPLSKALLKNVGPVFLLLIAATAYYNYMTLETFASGDIFGILDTGIGAGSIVLAALLMFLSIMAYYSLLYGTILNYIKFYTHDKYNIDQQGISSGVKTDFWSLLGLGILAAIMLVFGFLLCFIPGIYLMVPLSVVFCILVFEKKSVLDSISYCFTLIKDNWWITFATLIVFSILIYIISLVFQMPLIIYSFAKAFTGTEAVSGGNPYAMFDWVYITLSIVSNVFQYLLYTFYVIMSAFIYFNLNEIKNFTGTIETIESIGATKETEL